MRTRSLGRRLVAGALVLVLAAGLVASPGCAGEPPLGPIQRPVPYPDGSTAGAAFATYLWAWKTGDVDVLLKFLSLWMLYHLRGRLEHHSKAEVAAWYRRDTKGLALDDLKWTLRGKDLAYLRVTLSSDSHKPTRLDFSLMRRPDGWVVSGRKKMR